MIPMQFVHSGNIQSIELTSVDDKSVLVHSIVEKKHVMIVYAQGDLGAHGFIRIEVDYKNMDVKDYVKVIDKSIVGKLRASTSNNALEEHVNVFFPELIRVDLEDSDGNMSIKFVAKWLVINDWHDLAYGLSDKTPLTKKPEWLDTLIL